MTFFFIFSVFDLGSETFGVDGTWNVSTGESRGDKSRAPDIIVIIIIFLKYPWMFEWG